MSMIKVTVIDREGTSHELDAPTDMGMNMMELCKSAELPVEGTCGGMAMCATCHMYVKSDHAFPEKSDDEEDMLDEAFHVTDEQPFGMPNPLGRRPRRADREARACGLSRPQFTEAAWRLCPFSSTCTTVRFLDATRGARTCRMPWASEHIKLGQPFSMQCMGHVFGTFQDHKPRPGWPH